MGDPGPKNQVAATAAVATFKSLATISKFVLLWAIAMIPEATTKPAIIVAIQATAGTPSRIPTIRCRSVTRMNSMRLCGKKTHTSPTIARKGTSAAHPNTTTLAATPGRKSADIDGPDRYLFSSMRYGAGCPTAHSPGG